MMYYPMALVVHKRAGRALSQTSAKNDRLRWIMMKLTRAPRGDRGSAVMNVTIVLYCSLTFTRCNNGVGRHARAGQCAEGEQEEASARERWWPCDGTRLESRRTDIESGKREERRRRRSMHSQAHGERGAAGRQAGMRRQAERKKTRRHWHGPGGGRSARS